jgi:hypothetical protein
MCQINAVTQTWNVRCCHVQRIGIVTKSVTLCLKERKFYFNLTSNMLFFLWAAY